MNVGDIDTHLVVLFGLDTLRECHRLGLNLAEGVELGHGTHTLVSWQDGWEATIGVELEFLYSHATAEAATTGQFAGVIEEVVVALETLVTAMIRERACATFRHDSSLVSPRTCRRRSLRISQMLGHATCRIEQVVALGRLPLLGIGISHLGLLHDPWAFRIDILILLVSVALRRIGRTETFLGHLQIEHFAIEADHVLLQLHAIDAGIAPIEPCLTVIINHHRRIDVIPRAILIERLADGITEGACRRVADSNANGHALRQATVGTDIPVELTVALDGLRSPRTVVGPGEALEGQG